jgi:hypothetical protein
MLLRALYEGTASDYPWVAHNGVAWEMEELTCDGSLDVPLAYQTALLTRADERTRALTRETLLAVRAAADCALTMLDNCERANLPRRPFIGEMGKDALADQECTASQFEGTEDG